MTYEIQIGSNYNLATQEAEPATKFQITGEQAEILERFADVRRDEELNTLYVINNCYFKIVPIL